MSENSKKQKRKRYTKASHRKWCREHPEEARQLYGPWTSLEATIRILEMVLPGESLKDDGSDVLGELPFSPIDACEFACAWSAECGYDFSQPLCDTIAAFIKKGSKKTVKDLADVIERAICGDAPPKRTTFCTDGDDCPHFDIHDAYRHDTELCEGVDGPIQWKNQQCYLCKHWDNSNGGEPCDCTIGECTYRWKDPNGDSQQTFWEEN